MRDETEFRGEAENRNEAENRDEVEVLLVQDRACVGEREIELKEHARGVYSFTLRVATWYLDSSTLISLGNTICKHHNHKKVRSEN